MFTQTNQGENTSFDVNSFGREKITTSNHLRESTWKLENSPRGNTFLGPIFANPPLEYPNRLLFFWTNVSHSKMLNLQSLGVYLFGLAVRDALGLVFSVLSPRSSWLEYPKTLSWQPVRTVQSDGWFLCRWLTVSRSTRRRIIFSAFFFLFILVGLAVVEYRLYLLNKKGGYCKPPWL